MAGRDPVADASSTSSCQIIGRRAAGGAALLSPYLSDERAAHRGSEAFMKVHLPYGETTIEAELPENTRRLSNVEQARLPPLPDLAGAVRAALAAPRGLPRIGELVRPGAT